MGNAPVRLPVTGPDRLQAMSHGNRFLPAWPPLISSAFRILFPITCSLLLSSRGALAAPLGIRPVWGEIDGVVTVGYRMGDTVVVRAKASSPAGVEIRWP